MSNPGTSACHPPTSSEHFSNVVVVLFDISLSTESAEIKRRYREGFANKVVPLMSSGSGGLLAVAPITEDSLSSFDPLECTYPKKTGNSNPLVYASTTGAVTRIVQERADAIVDGPREHRGTAILDGMTAAGRYLGKFADADHRYLVIFSDMVEQSHRLKMTPAMLSRAGVAAAIARERGSLYFPHLSGVHVFVAGAGVSGDAGSRILAGDQVERFWLKYISATGATLRPDDYASVLATFP
jgi:hypothetical protein